jgi:hypothetical protein
VDAVIGAGVAPGYGPLGTHYNASPFAFGAALDVMWDLVGLTGTLPR